VPLVEAMTAGVPIVARDAGAVGQTVGDAALLLQAEDPAYVAAAVHRVCTDAALRRTLVTNGRRRAGELQGDAVARQFVDAIAGVVGRP
jgi:glycosyltransferase involved in cell wall biosynthesis